MTLGVFTFVLLLGNVFKDIVELLANRSVGLGTLAWFFALLMPYVLSFSMPMALLAATLLVMGRISADSELTACRACGISFFEVTLPILGVASILSFACFYINGWLAPQTKYLFNQTFVNLAFRHPMALLEEGQYIKDFDGMVIFIGGKDPRHETLKDVRVWITSGSRVTQEIHAREGKMVADSKLLKLKIQLLDARIDQRDPNDPTNLSKRRWAMTVAEYPIELDMTRMVDQRRAVKEIHHHTTGELWAQALDLKRQGIHPTPMLVEIQKRTALSVACIAFVLVALPFGVRVQRRETSVGILISLVLAICYYLLILFGETLKRNPHLYPEFIVWLPNLVFEATGLWLLWKQNRV